MLASILAVTVSMAGAVAGGHAAPAPTTPPGITIASLPMQTCADVSTATVVVSTDTCRARRATDRQRGRSGSQYCSVPEPTDRSIARQRDAIDLSVPVTVALLRVGAPVGVAFTASRVEAAR